MELDVCTINRMSQVGEGCSCHLFPGTRSTVHPGGDPGADKVHAGPPLVSGEHPPLSVSTLMHAVEWIVHRNLEKEESHVLS